VPLSKILTYVENLKVKEGIKTTQNISKSSRESLMCCEKLSSDKLHDSFENLSLPSYNSGDFSEVEDEYAN